MNRLDLIDVLNAKFPECNAVPSEDFDGSKDGIWFRGSEDCLKDGSRVFDYYNDDYPFGCNPKIDTLLSAHKWHSEAQDSGTMMAFPG